MAVGFFGWRWSLPTSVTKFKGRKLGLSFRMSSVWCGSKSESVSRYRWNPLAWRHSDDDRFGLRLCLVSGDIDWIEESLWSWSKAWKWKDGLVGGSAGFWAPTKRVMVVSGANPANRGVGRRRWGSWRVKRRLVSCTVEDKIQCVGLSVLGFASSVLLYVFVGLSVCDPLLRFGPHILVL